MQHANKELKPKNPFAKVNINESLKKVQEEKERVKKTGDKIKERKLDFMSSFLIGVYLFIATVITGIFFNASGGISFAVVFNIFFIARSISIAILGVGGYILLAWLSMLSAERTKEFLEARKEKREEIRKLDQDNLRKQFNYHRLNINHRNKLEAWQNYIDYKLDTIRGWKRIFIWTRKTWLRRENQIKAYITYHSLQEPENENKEQLEQYKQKQDKLLKDINNFNLSNVKIDFNEWTETMFLSSGGDSTLQDNENPKDRILKSLTKQKVKKQLLIWAFTTSVTAISISSLTLGVEGIIGTIINLGFIIYACITGWQDGWSAKLTDGINKIKMHINFIRDFKNDIKPNEQAQN